MQEIFKEDRIVGKAPYWGVSSVGMTAEEDKQRGWRYFSEDAPLISRAWGAFDEKYGVLTCGTDLSLSRSLLQFENLDDRVKQVTEHGHTKASAIRRIVALADTWHAYLATLVPAIQADRAKPPQEVSAATPAPSAAS